MESYNKRRPQGRGNKRTNSGAGLRRPPAQSSLTAAGAKAIAGKRTSKKTTLTHTPPEPPQRVGYTSLCTNARPTSLLKFAGEVPTNMFTFGDTHCLFHSFPANSELHDGDLHSFLYLGSRLDSGELLYFNDFETKLPLLQYIFWIPYRLGGIGAWRLITFAVSLLLSLVSSHLIVRSLIQNSQRPNLLSRTITTLSASVFLSFLYSLPGSSSAHIEIFAAIFIYHAISLWHAEF
jgi:hypothetical protein